MTGEFTSTSLNPLQSNGVSGNLAENTVQKRRLRRSLKIRPVELVIRQNTPNRAALHGIEAQSADARVQRSETLVAVGHEIENGIGATTNEVEKGHDHVKEDRAQETDTDGDTRKLFYCTASE